MFGVALRRLSILRIVLQPVIHKVMFHSKSQTFSQSNMRIKVLAALQDNYMYLLIDERTRECAVVDPVEPEKVMKAVNEENVKLTSVLTTHHHWDHAGGNNKLLKLAEDLKLQVFGGDERVDGLTTKVTEGDIIKIGDLKVTCMFTPCHTKGHICYYVPVPKDSNEHPAVFTGDTLFIAGCGKFFEGTPEDMYAALIEKLSSLPKNTHVFCGHEYTVNNLKYAASIEPNNTFISEKTAWAKKQRAEGYPTVPSTIEEEQQYNPFMRVKEESILKRTGNTEPIKTMGWLRKDKDNFRI